MKKTFIIFAAIVIYTAPLHAQSKTVSRNHLIFSIGLEPSIVIGKIHGTSYTFSGIGSIQLEDKIADNLGVTLNLGYHDFTEKDVTFVYTYTPGYFGLFPLLAGLKYYISSIVYGHVQLGAAISTGKYSNVVKSGTSFFAYSPGVGFILSKRFDVLFKYSGFSGHSTNLNLLGARLAYNF
ncbi:MAG TPA: outer membrane beta-barrel protein [Chitinophagaceae bacterium]|nr:outer membrane beta-barrel protein [Chitinophagaceae bacterium]